MYFAAYYVQFSRLLMAVILVFCAGGCEDFLDKKPESDVADVSLYFQKPDHAVAALTAVYDVLQWEFDEGNSGAWYSHNLYFFGDICSDDANKGGKNDADGKAILDLSNFEGNSGTAEILAVWNINYAGIARANFAIEGIRSMELDDRSFNVLKPRYLAEAKFLRAFYYFNLAKMFGGVVVTDHLLSPSEYNTPRSTGAETWAFIEKDLQEAAAALPLKSAYQDTDYGRPTKGAALAYLTKAYVFQKKWSQAKQTAEQVINSGEYALVTNYQSIFESGQEHGEGSIFEINFTSKLLGGWPPNGSDGNALHTFMRSRNENIEGWGWNVPTQSLYDAFEENDHRREATIIKDGDIVYGALAQNNAMYHPRKYRLEPSEEPSLVGGGDHKYNGPQNLRMFRYADLLLLHAEAAAQSGDEPAALVSLNKVRKRARDYTVSRNASFNFSKTLLPDRSSTGATLLADIYHERRVELALEGHRFFDLARQGRGEEVLHAFGKTKYNQQVHKVFPVPLLVIQRTNGAVTQNNGW